MTSLFINLCYCNDCSYFCSKVYQPLCGISENGSYKTFPNECIMDLHNCVYKHIKYEKISYGECLDVNKQCSFGCTWSYNPICVKSNDGNYETFANECIFNLQKCKYENHKYEIVAYTECPNGRYCSNLCNLNYELLCAETILGHRKTFLNQCYLNLHNCRYETNQYTYIYEGMCDDHCFFTCNQSLYDPICTISNNDDNQRQQFPNDCELNLHNCKEPDNKFIKIKNGRCTYFEDECNSSCFLYSEPICAKQKDGNLRTFWNECDMNAVNCYEKTNFYEKIKNGEC